VAIWENITDARPKQNTNVTTMPNYTEFQESQLIFYRIFQIQWDRVALTFNHVFHATRSKEALRKKYFVLCHTVDGYSMAAANQRPEVLSAHIHLCKYSTKYFRFSDQNITFPIDLSQGVLHFLKVINQVRGMATTSGALYRTSAADVHWKSVTTFTGFDTLRRECDSVTGFVELLGLVVSISLLLQLFVTDSVEVCSSPQ
jgi:hypothetical protein